MLARYNPFGGLARFSGRDFGSPFDTLDQLRHEMNRLFFDFESGYPSAFGESQGAFPKFSLEDRGAAFELRAEVPGLSQEELELHVDEGTVSLKGERTSATPEGASVHRQERSSYSFARSFTLPTKVDPDKVDARLEHGVLTVTLPKAKEAQPRPIKVRAV